MIPSREQAPMTGDGPKPIDSLLPGKQFTRRACITTTVGAAWAANNGGEDQGITAEQIGQMRATLAKAGSKSQIHACPDAPHAFHADHRPSYRQETAEDGWMRMLEGLKQNGTAAVTEMAGQNPLRRRAGLAPRP